MWFSDSSNCVTVTTRVWCCWSSVSQSWTEHLVVIKDSARSPGPYKWFQRYEAFDISRGSRTCLEGSQTTFWMPRPVGPTPRMARGNIDSRDFGMLWYSSYEFLGTTHGPPKGKALPCDVCTGFGKQHQGQWRLEHIARTCSGDAHTWALKE